MFLRSDAGTTVKPDPRFIIVLLVKFIVQSHQRRAPTVRVECKGGEWKIAEDRKTQ